MKKYLKHLKKIDHEKFPKSFFLKLAKCYLANGGIRTGCLCSGKSLQLFLLFCHCSMNAPQSLIEPHWYMKILSNLLCLPMEDLDAFFENFDEDDDSSQMASQYLQSSRQVVNYSPVKQSNGQSVQQPATSMYTTTSGFQTFQTVFTPTYADANGDHTKIEPHDGDGQVRVSFFSFKVE